MITQETLSDGENRVRIYDEKGTCLLSCVDRDLEEKAVGTSMEGIQCNWDFDQIYYYRNYKENVGDSSTIWYCNKDTRHGYKWSDKGRDAVYVGHVLLLPDIQDAFIVPSEVTREIETNSVSIRILNECETNGEIVLYNNHKLDISKRDFDTTMDYIPDITEEDTVFFANPDVIEVQKREGEELNCYYYQVGEKQGQLLDENENYKWNCDFYDGIALKHIVVEDGTSQMVLIDENGNQIPGTEAIKGISVSEYFSLNQYWLVWGDDEQYTLVDREGNAVETTIIPENLDWDAFNQERIDNADEGIYGANLVSIEEPGHIYEAYIYDNKIWTTQLK